MTTAELVNLLGIWSAAIFGMFVIFGRKGTWSHRWMGRGYMGATIVVGLAALGMLDGRTSFSLVQFFALLGLVALVFGYAMIRSTPRTYLRVTLHGHFMAFSVVCMTTVLAVQGAGFMNRPEAPVAGVVFLLGLLVMMTVNVRRRAHRFAEDV